MPEPIIRRTYEPLKFLGKTLGRFMWVPLRVEPKTQWLSVTPTWEAEGARWAPTVVARIPLTRWALGLGIWFDAPDEIVAVHDEEAEYATYVAVNGAVPFEQWQTARREIAALGLDPDQEMELMQARGVFL